MADDDVLLARTRLVLTALWLLFLGSWAVGNIVNFGVYNYVSHLTDWGLTLQIIFYACTLFALSRAERWALRWLYCAVNGIVVGIAVGVLVLLGSGSTFLVRLFRDMAPSIVVVGNDAIHTFPLIAIIIFYSVHSRELTARALQPSRAWSAWRMLAFYAYQLFGGTGAVVAVYMLINNVNSIYYTHIDRVAGLCSFILISMLANLFPLYRAARRYDAGGASAPQY